MAAFYARIMERNKYKYPIVFAAGFVKQNEDNQVLDETELYIKLNIYRNLTETDLDVRFALEEEIEKQEMKHSG